MDPTTPRDVPVDDADVTETATPAGDFADERNELGFWLNWVAQDPERQTQFDEARARIELHQATLAQVRKARAFTQERLAELLDMSQSEVSKLERRTDLLLSTLRSYIEASGGELHLIANYPDSEPIELVIGID